MPTDNDPRSTHQIWLDYFKSIQQAGGDQRLRETLSAMRGVAQNDIQISPENKAKLAASYARVEAELLPSSSSNDSPTS
jgi:hypothetical protein